MPTNTGEVAGTAHEVELSSLIDQRPVGRFQIQVIFLCVLVAMLDGFDTQLIAFVAPAIAQTWNVEITSFGIVFAAGLLGLTFGAAGLGLLADRIGRKKAIVLSTALFGSFALLTTFAQSVFELTVFRFLTGVGLGGAMPNIIALTAEYAPRRSRSTLITLMFCGFPLGAVIGGPISSGLIETFGWKSVFLLGGMLPLALLPVLVWKLPESIRFLARATGGAQRLVAVLTRLCPGSHHDGNTRYVISEARSEGSPIRYLFSSGRGLVTLLLWLVFFSNLLMIYFLINWLPVILQRAGFELDDAIFGTVLINAGGIVGGLTLGRLIDWKGAYRVLAYAYMGAAMFVALTGYFSHYFAATLALVFLSGFCVIGAQFGANALAAGIYPTAVRATGVGWALGVGRVGAIVGPLLGSVVIAQHWPLERIFLATAIPAAMAAVAVIFMSQATARR